MVSQSLFVIYSMPALTNTVEDVAHLCGDIAPIQQACGPIEDDIA